VHNLTIGNLTVRADPSIRAAAIDESDWPLSEHEAARAAPALASLERAVGREEGRRRAHPSLVRDAARAFSPSRPVLLR
jgi:hypothetical protein